MKGIRDVKFYCDLWSLYKLIKQGVISVISNVTL